MTYFVKSFGWYRMPEELFISLEYFPLGDLQSYMNGVVRVPEDEVREITQQMLFALSIMHKEGFAHRDLKPAVSQIYMGHRCIII
jgi:serine/threonine protein kinase